MNRRLLPVWLLPIWLGVACVSAQAASEPGELINHPYFTVNGCPLDREWTDEVVNDALGLKPRMLQRLKNRFSIEKERLCSGSWDDLEGFVLQANNPKHRTDSPDAALAFRAMQQRDESRTVRNNGLFEALIQRAAMSASLVGQARAVLPDAAGVSSNAWTWLGPGNIGGRVRAISPHPTTANDILIGSVSGGIWRTTDGGTSWTPLTDFLANVAVACLVRNPVDPTVIYACTGEGFFNQDAVRGLGIFKSTDNGVTWTQVATTNPTTAGADWFYVNRLAISPTNPLIMLAATNGGVYRSVDGAVTWTKTYGVIPGTTNTRRVLDISFHPVNGNIAILGEGRHFNGTANDGAAVAYSADGGVSWTRTVLNTATKTGNAGRVEIAIAKSDPTIVYASVDMNSGELYRSTDGGVTWTPNAPRASNTALTNVLSNQGWYDNAIWVAPNDSNRIIIGGVGMRMSINGGTSWTSIGSSVHSDHHALVSDPNYATNFTLYGGNDGGVYRATSANTATPSGNSPSWTNLNNGLGITQFYGGAGKLGGRITGGTQDNGSLYWVGTTNWLQFFGADGGDSAADPVDGNYIYGETQNGGIVRYTQAMSNPVGGGGEYICAGILDADCAFMNAANRKINFIPPIRLDPNNASTLLVGADRLWKSNNIKASAATAVTWSAIKPSLGESGNYISAIAVAPGNSNVIWVGYNFGDVACTTNGTAASPTWVAVPGTPDRMVTRITIDDTNNNRVYIANGGYSAPNLHATWMGCSAAPNYTAIHNQLPAAPIRALTRHPTQSTWLYAGTEVGLFTSEDNGASWFTTNDGPGTVSVEEIFFLDANTLIAATHGRGMYSASAGVGPGSVGFSAATQSVKEPSGSVTVSVSRSLGVNGAISVSYATSGGTATSGVDFTATSGILTWADGDGGPKSFTIPVLADSLVEGTETFSVTLSSPTGGATIVAPSTQTISIIDADLWPPGGIFPTGYVTPGTSSGAWTTASDFFSEGSTSLRSAQAIGTDSVNFNVYANSDLEYTASFNAGNVTFAYRVSSYSSFYGQLEFMIDGIVAFTSAGGETGWLTANVPLTAGNHTLRWRFKNKLPFACANATPAPPGGAACADRAWIDAVVMPLTVSVPPTSASNDLSGDGKSDLVWRNTDGSVVGWLMNGLSATSSSYFLGAGSGWTVKHIGDFSGDGKKDLLWLHNDGTTVMWLMNGLSLVSSATLLGAGSGWSVKHIGDFNGDGKRDLIWQHTDGTTVMWLMNGTSLVSSTTLLGANSGWSVSHIGDFNADGKSDLVWRHTDGTVVMWLMNGLSLTSSATMLGANSGWTVKHIGDFNGDGKNDLVWQHNDGTNVMWLMNGLSITSSATLLGAGSGWSVKHIGDFNGDGKSDLVWQHTDGTNVVWLMNGISLSGSNTLLGAGSGWSVKQIGDFNGDGKNDLFWQHTDGTTAMWLMNGLSPSSSGILLGAGSGWSPLP